MCLLNSKVATREEEEEYDIFLLKIIEKNSISMGTNQNRLCAFYSMFRRAKKTAAFVYLYNYNFHIVK